MTKARLQNVSSIIHVLIAGVGAGLSYIPALSAPMRRFHEKHAASIAGTITTAEAVGPLIYTFIYDTYFSGDGSFLGQDLRGYMLFLPASILVTHLIGLVIFGWYQYDNVEPEMIPIIVKDKHKIRQSIPMDDIHNLQSIDSAVASCSSTVQDPVNDTIERSINESNLECTPIQMIKTPTFQIMIWSTVLVHNMKLFCIYNVNVFLVSLKMQKYATVLPFLSPASSAVSKTAFGWLIEKLRGRFSLAWYMVIACVINIIFFVLGLIYLSNIYVLAFGIVFWTFASDVALVIEPVMNLEYFGKAMISINYGFFMGLWSAVTFLNQLWFGKAYEFYADPASGMCYGDHCFRLQQITNLVISLICFGLSIAFYAIDLKQKVKILITGSNVMLQSEQWCYIYGDIRVWRETLLKPMLFSV